jgi:SAM-dependent methyltransferase
MYDKGNNNYPPRPNTNNNSYDKNNNQLLMQKISDTSWYHSYELVPGLKTPGILPIDAAEILDSLNIPKNLEGKQALDIGSWDGPIAFELEKRGASTIAVDIQNPNNTGFNVAKEILNSDVNYIQSSVYDLTTVLDHKSFDLICFFGVFYHLKHPILAFEEISKVLKNEGILIFEGECFLNYAEPYQYFKNYQNLEDSSSSYDEEISIIASSSLPITLCYPGQFKNSSNWFIPNVACIFSWLDACGLEMICYHLYNNKDSPSNPLQRITGIAKKSQSGIREEHPIVPKNWR